MTTDKIFQLIKSHHGLTLKQIQSQSRKEDLVYARRTITNLMSKQNCSINAIAAKINRDRCTIIRYLKTNSDEWLYNPKFRCFFDAVCLTTLKLEIENNEN